MYVLTHFRLIATYISAASSQLEVTIPQAGYQRCYLRTLKWLSTKTNDIFIISGRDNDSKTYASVCMSDRKGEGRGIEIEAQCGSWYKHTDMWFYPIDSKTVT